ncbi:hypothetical protein [Halosolutus gelatinilyticus]|uniref:hypothetical protein n=1 Tax=Halosolutus gelatinilyticus TaxID=2931975 RepID=UPI001FF191E2|nr:hypothetical protein [Halosolutus gelatinilyticus]
MVPDVEFSRRRTIRLAALSGTSALVAGCIDTFDEGTSSEVDGSGENEGDDGSGAADDPADAAGGDDGDDSDDEATAADVDRRFVLEANVGGWIGVEPAPIEGVENPTLGLVAGREYELVWENGDGIIHDFVIRNDDDETLHATDFVEEEGDTRTIAFEATEEMSHYVCRPHKSVMNGDTVVFSE